MIGVPEKLWVPFKNELIQQAAHLGIDYGTALLAFYIACGMPSWVAYIHVCADVPSVGKQLDPTKANPMKLKSLAETAMKASRIQELTDWIVTRGSELGVYEESRFQWSKSDSEFTLRLLLDETIYRIRNQSRATPDWFNLARTLTKDLTDLYQLNQEKSMTHKVVVFENERELG